MWTQVQFGISSGQTLKKMLRLQQLVSMINIKDRVNTKGLVRESKIFLPNKQNKDLRLRINQNDMTQKTIYKYL